MRLPLIGTANHETPFFSTVISDVSARTKVVLTSHWLNVETLFSLMSSPTFSSLKILSKFAYI